MEAIGDGVTGVEVGDHVLLSFSSCGVCSSCLGGHPSYCIHLYDLDFGGARPDGSTAFTAEDGTSVSSHFFGQSSFASVSNVAERSVVTQMTKSLGILGHGALVGAAAPGTESPIDIGSLLLSGLKISMVVEGDSVPQTFIPQLISLYEAGVFFFDELIKKYDFVECGRCGLPG